MLIPTMNRSITDIKEIYVGHYTDLTAATGCTVLLCPRGTVAGVDVRGGAPGTRDVALLDPVCTVNEVHAILLSGGSAYGLAAVDGVMTWLEEQGIGFETNFAKVPIVPSAILFDLAVGSPKIRPSAENGYEACQNAHSDPVDEGNVGAGTGASVGKLKGSRFSTKAGIGSDSITLENGLTIGAIVAVNAIGDVIDPTTNCIIAGARSDSGAEFANSMAILRERAGASIQKNDVEEVQSHNTTIGVVATNAHLTKTDATKVAQMAHDGLARTIYPVHTAMDGDTIFALATNSWEARARPADVSQIGAIAAEVLATAVIRGVHAAETLHGVPAAKDL